MELVWYDMPIDEAIRQLQRIESRNPDATVTTCGCRCDYAYLRVDTPRKLPVYDPEKVKYDNRGQGYIEG